MNATTIFTNTDGKEYHHGLEKAPFFIDLNRTGKWSLQAELTIKNPQTGENMSLKDHVDFIVNPVEINLTPTRKVLDFSAHKSQELSLNITLNGKKVEKPGKPVEWSDDGLKAVVDPIEWFSATAPNGCAIANHEEDNLTANINFAKTGAATVLATVTVRLVDGKEYFRRQHKGFEDEFEEPIFTFPAVRADIWAVPAPSWLDDIDAHFPSRAITAAKRTFRVKKGKFKVWDNSAFTWSPSGFEQPIEIKPAFPGVVPITGSGIQFSWVGPNGNSGNGEVFQPRMGSEPSQKITLNSELVFSPYGVVAFNPLEKEIAVEKLEDLLSPEVEPSEFALVVDGKIQMKFLLFTPGNPIGAVSLKVLNDAFRAEISDVVWSQGSEILGNGNPFIYHAVQQTIEPIIGNGEIALWELVPELALSSDEFHLTASSNPLIVAPKIDLQVIDLFGPVSEDSENTHGAFIHFNFDNDNRNTSEPNDPHMGPPVADYTETDFVQGENDLCPAKIKLLSLAMGKVTLKRDNDQLRVWCSPAKEATSAIILDESEKTWDLTNEKQTKHFEAVKENLWVEGLGKGSSGLAVQYSYHAEKYDSADWVKFTFFSANCGRQPTPNEEDVLKIGMSMPLVDCEYSITGERDNKYNCIAWSVGETDVQYWWVLPDSHQGHSGVVYINIDEVFGNNNKIMDLEDIDLFYASKSYDLIADYPKPEEADVIFYDKFHAARKINCSDGKGKWIFFDSKLGESYKIEHLLNQLSLGYGKPSRSYKKRRD